MAVWRLALGLLAVGAYLALSHWLTLHAAGQPWALAAWVAPLWIVAVPVAVRQRSWAAAAGLLAIALAVAVIVSRGGLGDIRQLYLLQHAGIHLVLTIVFANSLRGERLSLIGGVATRVHGQLTAEMQAYTRRVTISWVVYFFLMTLASVAVYLLFSWTVWSFLANIATPLMIAILFVGEFLLRYWLHPEFERATLMDAARAYSRTSPR